MPGHLEVTSAAFDGGDDLVGDMLMDVETLLAHGPRLPVGLMGGFRPRPEPLPLGESGEASARRLQTRDAEAPPEGPACGRRVDAAARVWMPCARQGRRPLGARPRRRPARRCVRDRYPAGRRRHWRLRALAPRARPTGHACGATGKLRTGYSLIRMPRDLLLPAEHSTARSSCGRAFPCMHQGYPAR